MNKVEIEQLKKFLYNANKNGYAGTNAKVAPQRPGFEEIEFSEGEYTFHDSYSGHYFAPGQEIVYKNNQPIWAMAYSGGMKEKFHGDEEVTHNTIIFLKKALLAMNPQNPYRGPEFFNEDKWKYVSNLNGDIDDFLGNEKIYFDGELVFEQNFIGGLIV